MNTIFALFVLSFFLGLVITPYVGRLTAPKQEKWIHQNKDKLNVKFIGTVAFFCTFRYDPSIRVN